MPDLVFVTYTQAQSPRRTARSQAVKDLVRKQALKAYYSPQGSDLVEERQRESDALDKVSRKRHMGRFRLRKEEVGETGLGLSGRRVYAFEPYISSLGPGAWELLEYFRNCFRMKSMSIHADKDWFNFTMSETSLSQATLCLVSLNKDFAHGTTVSPTTLHHRAAAMKQLKQEISTPGTERETVAGTVAILAIAEDMEGNFTNSSAHFDGMAQIAKACGGLRWFKGERSCMILKIIAWADLCHAAAWLSEPHLLGWFDNVVDNSLFQPDERICDPAFRRELERLTCPHLRSLMDILHHYPHPIRMEESPVEERAHWQRLLMMTEQMVVQLNERIPYEGSVPALSRAFTSAVQLYVPAVLRRTPLPRIAASFLTEGILKELHEFQIRARVEEGRSPRNLLVLWTQVNTLTALSEENGRVKLARDFQETLSAMDINSQEDLLEQLSCIAWSASSLDDTIIDILPRPQLTAATS